jgi:EAL domain-containing protein (putative c-di-GMP-specific phosphodiesterase class I)
VEAVFAALAEHPVTDSLVFINLNPATLEHPLFWKRVRPWLWDLPIPPHRIVLEVTETHGPFDLDQMEGFGRRMRDMGVQVAVDDLGSGSASLSHMARLAPDFIKVDRSLIVGLDRHPYQAALLEALARFSERMRVGLIAEGMETMEELQAVVDADVPWGQGYLFGQPEPLRLP